MASIQNLKLSVGIITLDVGMVLAAEDGDKETSLSRLHNGCGGQTGTKPFCKLCNKELTPADFIHGYEVSKGQFIHLTEQEVKGARAATTGVVRTLEVVDVAEVADKTPMLSGKCYYLVPDLETSASVAAYGLLLDSLRRQKQAIIGEVGMYGTTFRVAIVAGDQCFLMHRLRFPNDVRTPQALPPLNLDPNQAKLMDMILGTLHTGTMSMNFSSDKVGALMQVINAKKANQPVPSFTPQSIPTVNVPDTTEMLKQALAAIQAEKAAAPAPAAETKEPEAKPEAKKKPGKKGRAA